jgi:IS1 family transposase
MLGDLRLSEEKVVFVLRLLCEGTSVRAAERLSGVHRNTVLSILELAGQKAQTVLENRLRNLNPEHIEIDELWSFVHTKQWKAKTDPIKGDQYLFLSFDSKHKVILNHHVGKRDRDNAMQFMGQLRQRLVPGHRYQISSDCWHPYLKRGGVIYKTFGESVDHTSIYKQYAKADASNPFSRRVIVAFIKNPSLGKPNMARATTSFLERQNANVRLFNKRFSRLTVCFSKKLENLKHSVALFVAYHNFCRKHNTLGMTPAMSAGLAWHCWSIQDLLTEATRIEARAGKEEMSFTA